MDLKRHCVLCDYEIKSLKIGTTCGLTGQKPKFKSVCSKISLNSKFLKKLEETNLQLDIISKSKNFIYFTFFLMIIVGCLLVLASSTIAGWTYNETFFWYYKIGAIALGISTFISAFFNLNKFREKLKSAKYKKYRIDEVLDEYGISYTTNFEYRKKVHGSQEIEVFTEFKDWKKTRHISIYKK